MKPRRFSVITAIALTILLIAYCLWRCTTPKPEYKIITISGSSFSNNMSKTYLKFGSLADSGKTAAVMVSEGDLLYLIQEPTDNPVIFRYNLSDGQSVRIGTDTTYIYESYLNDKLNSLYFNDSADVADWLKQNDSSGIHGLRAIHINGSAINEDISFLEDIAALNPSLGLVLENLDQEKLTRVLSMFHPEWLFLMDSGLKGIGDKLVPNLNNVEIMIIDAEYEGDLGYLSRLPNLHSLIIEGYHATDSAAIDFDRIKNLTSISFLNAGIGSLAEVKLPRHLQSLLLIDCDRLTDISALSTLPHLCQLNLLACDTLTDLSALDNLHNLQLLSLPPGASQQDFIRITGQNRSLKSVGLIGCEGINDLSPLKKLDGLISLELDLPEIDFGTLEQLTGIKLIVIEQNKFNASTEKVAALAKALPGAQIVPGGGFCMGSGWILLIMPVLFIAGMLNRKRNR